MRNSSSRAKPERFADRLSHAGACRARVKFGVSTSVDIPVPPRRRAAAIGGAEGFPEENHRLPHSKIHLAFRRAKN
jgi:hypothetical protein